MKKETRKEERVVVSNYTVYIANDGTEFDSERACERHEICAEIDRTEKEVENLRLHFYGTPLDYHGYADAESCEWYKINNEDDFQKLLDYYNARTSENVDLIVPCTYPTVICVSEDDTMSGSFELENAYGYTLEYMKKTTAEFFANFGIKVTFDD